MRELYKYKTQATKEQEDQRQKNVTRKEKKRTDMAINGLRKEGKLLQEW